MKSDKKTSSPVRVNDQLMNKLRELLEPLGADSDAQSVRWACESFIALVEDAKEPPAVPPVASVARNYISNSLPRTKRNKGKAG